MARRHADSGTCRHFDKETIMADYLGNSRSDAVLLKPVITQGKRPAKAPSIGLRITLIGVGALLLALIGVIAQTIATDSAFPFSELLGKPTFRARAGLQAMSGSPASEEGDDIQYSP